MINLRSLSYLLFFFSGFAALVYEVVWTRQLSAIFGSTGESVGVVLAVFMGGMALGGFFLGRAADGVKNRFLFFAVLEAAIGVYGLLASMGFSILENFYFSGGPPQSGMNVILSVAYMFIPSFLIGGTLPALSRFCSGDERRNFGLAAGGLYAVNTLGAAGGALITGFVLLEQLGAAASVRTAGFINLAVAVTALVLMVYTSKEEETRKDEAGAVPETPTSGPSSEEIPAADAPGGIAKVYLFMAFFMAGSSTLAHEVIWTRLLSQFFKNSIYSFSTMLFAVLLGLAAGGGAGSLMSRRFKSRTFALCLVQALAGLVSLCTIFLVASFSDIQSYTQVLVRFGCFESFGRLALFEVLAALALVFPPAFLMGMSFPIMAGMAWRPVKRFSGFIGDLQFVLTAGGVFGALIMALYLIPANIAIKKGLLDDLLFAVAANFFAALLLLLVLFRKTGWPRLALASGLLAAGVGLGCFQYNVVPGDLRFWRGLPTGEELIFYKSDPIAEVAVVQRPDGLIMKVNNTSGLGGTAGDFLETRLGMLPLIFKRGSERALLMGLGTGNTLYGLLTSGAKDVDCVEMLPSVVAASRAFHNFDRETLTGGRLRIILGDARTFLRTYDESKDPETGLANYHETYDLIIGDLYFPWQSEAGFMYTREHFRRVKERLSEDGVFFQWLPLHQLRWEEFGIIGYTFCEEVFEHVAVFLAAPNVGFPIIGLAGSRKPIRLDPVTLQEELDAHPQAALLEKYAVNNAMDLVALYMGNEWLFRSHFNEIELNTEDRTVVEYRSARVFEDSDQISYNNFRKLAEPGFKEYAVTILDLPEMETRARLEIEEKVKGFSEALRLFLEVQALFLREEYLARIGYKDKPDERKRIWDRMGSGSLSAYQRAPDYKLVEDNLFRLWQFLINEKEITPANKLMGRVLGINRTLGISRNNDTFYNKLGLGFMLEGEYDKAVFCLSGAVQEDEKNYSAKANLAIAYFLRGDRVRARDEMEPVIEKVGYKNLSELTAAMAVLILQGRSEALPYLAPFTEKPLFKDLIQAALKSAAEGVMTDTGDEEESEGP